MPAPDGQPTNQEVVRIVLRPIGNSLPLGMFAFAVGTTIFGAVEIGWIPPSQTLPVVLVMLAFTAPLEAIASIFGFLARDAAVGATMGIFAAGWTTLGLCYLMLGSQAHTAAIGIFLVVDAISVLLIGIAAATGKPLVSVILVLAAIRFFASASVEFGAGEDVRRAAGSIGLLLGVLALYGGLATLLEDLQEHPVLPIGRLGKARQSTQGTLDDQIRSVHHDAGVRDQL
jgi:succinate-acetate transporter protein